MTALVESAAKPAPVLQKARIDRAVAIAIARLRAQLPRFTDEFPAPSSINGTFPAMDNSEWTNGFWTGSLWLAYELSGDPVFRTAAERQVATFTRRIDDRNNVEHHDLGFLYSLSCVAAYKLTGNEAARASALKAADTLLTRFLPVAGIIQAWGDLNDPEESGRMIIDCNLNLPLLYWASDTTGNPDYRDAANQHIAQAAKYIVRPDYSTYHTFYLDTKTGGPRHGSTHQGYSDTSCWARGQAWGMYGFPLAFRYNRDAGLVDLSTHLADYFLARLPADGVCCWDLVFTDDVTERDTSAAAIAACGLLEMARQLPLLDTRRADYEAWAGAIMVSLTKNYGLAEDDPSDGLLSNAVYHMPKGIGVNERCLWGDYFYLEGLMRLSRTWEPYW